MRLDHLLSMEKRGETHKNPMVRITDSLLNTLFNFEDPQRKLNRDVPNGELAKSLNRGCKVENSTRQ